MGSYPAAKRTGQTETLMYAERERLYDRGLTRDQMNSLMERLQTRLGSKNKLGEAVYQRKNSASRIKQVMEGAQRYTDTVIDRIVEVARENGVPLLTDVPPSNEPEADAVDLQESSRDEMPHAPDHGHAPDVPSAVAGDRPGEAHAEPEPESPAVPDRDRGPEASQHGGAAPEDWLSGVRRRREQIMRQVVDHEEAIAARRAEILRLEGEIERIAAARDADAANIGEIDSALSILQTI